MNKFNLIIILVIFSLSVNSQIINLNPDKDAEPWIVGGLRIPSQEEIDKVPVIKIFDKNGSKDLPSSLDNSTEDYFRPIFNQTDGCCAQASGIAYNYTYEMNRENRTSANVPGNQFPTHYTYNFLNGGSGANGSWFWDGWEIINSNGCPNVSTYGGLAQNATYWMSGYDNYLSGKSNRVSDIFSIDVSTPEGLEVLKHWMFDHLEGDSDGSIVNFSAGVSDVFNMTWDNKIVKWGAVVNHAMTFVGWDDNIEYDFNNDGSITNDVDINNDGIVNMQDWEKGALIMVNSWGTFWGDNGKAYVMYKLLADPVLEGGIFSNKVYSINVNNDYTPQLMMKVKMTHNSRNKIKIFAGVSSNLSSAEPEYTIDFPLFNKQGGEFDMRGTSTSPIEIVLDVTPLLGYINSDQDAKFFLLVDENDGAGLSSGLIYDFSIIDNASNEFVCTSHNVSIINDDLTKMSVNGAVTFEAPEIITASLPAATVNEMYSYQLNASGGQDPYKWTVLIDYSEEVLSGTFPTASTQLIPTDYDDGYASQTIEFDFPFYGTEYSQLYINTDGSIIFEPDFTYIRSEDAIKGAKVISVFASDLMIFPANGDGIFYEGDENSATFKWKTALYGNESANIEVAITLFPSGEIRFFYGNDITPDLDWASGISSGDRTNYIISSNSGYYNPENEKLKFLSQPFPKGMSMKDNGLFEGIPTEVDGSWDITFAVTDNNNITKTKLLNFYTIPLSVNIIEDEFVKLFPNPFKESVFISYSIENKTNVEFLIYDISGKLIKTILNKNMVSGDYKFEWKPNVPKGLYLYKINTDNFTETGKLIFQ